MAANTKAICRGCGGILDMRSKDAVNACERELVQTLDGRAETVESGPIYWFHRTCFPANRWWRAVPR